MKYVIKIVDTRKNKVVAEYEANEFLIIDDQGHVAASNNNPQAFLQAGMMSEAIDGGEFGIEMDIQEPSKSPTAAQRDFLRRKISKMNKDDH